MFCQQQGDIPAIRITDQVAALDPLGGAEVDHIPAELGDGVRGVDRPALTVPAAIQREGVIIAEMVGLVSGEDLFALRIAMQKQQCGAAAVFTISDTQVGQVLVLGGEGVHEISFPRCLFDRFN